MSKRRKIAVLCAMAFLIVVSTAQIQNPSGGAATSAAFNVITGGTNTTAAMVVGTGASIATSGSGTNTATAVPFSGISGATNTTGAMIIGTGGSLTVSGSGTINATSLGGNLANTYAPLVSPSFTTPTLGVATATSINKMAITPPATSSTLAIADGKTLTVSNTGTINGGDAWVLAIAAAKTLTVSNTLTLSGTDGQSWAFPTGNGTFVGTGTTQNLTLKTLTSPILATLVTDTSMGSTTAAMTAQSSATCTNITGMTWAIAANKNYRLQCEIPRTLAASATLAYCIGGPGTPTSYSITVRGLNGASSAWSQQDLLAQGTYGTKTTASTANANNATDQVVAFIQNGATASGTALTLQTAANGTNNITVGANAVCDLKQVN